jgi:putative two-component system response regulator
MVHRHNLLLIDQEKHILRCLMLTFEEDYNVFTAASTSEALDILERENIALVITDHQLVNDFDNNLVDQVLHFNPQTIHIILTPYLDTRSIIHAIASGKIYCHIPKPWNRNELKTRVKLGLDAYESTMSQAYNHKQLNYNLH